MEMLHQNTPLTTIYPNTYTRRGLSYYAETVFEFKDGRMFMVKKKLAFIAYHLIKFFHGEAILKEMANADFDKVASKMREMGHDL